MVWSRSAKPIKVGSIPPLDFIKKTLLTIYLSRGYNFIYTLYFVIMNIKIIIVVFCIMFNTNILTWEAPTDDVGRPGDRGDAALY